MPNPVQCYTNGTHFRCLTRWIDPNGDFVGFPTWLRTFTPLEDKRNWEITFFYIKMATLSSNCNWWHSINGYCFLNYTTKIDKNEVLYRMSNESRAWIPPKGFVDPCGNKFGIMSSPVRKQLSFGPFGTRQSRSMNGGHILLQHPSPSNVCFAFLIQANQLSINHWIVSKLCELGDGLPSSCMNFVGLGPTFMIVFIGNKVSLVRGSPKSCQTIQRHHTLDDLDQT